MVTRTKRTAECRERHKGLAGWMAGWWFLCYIGVRCLLALLALLCCIHHAPLALLMNCIDVIVCWGVGVGQTNDIRGRGAHNDE